MNKYQEALHNLSMYVVDDIADGYNEPKFLRDFYYTDFTFLDELVERATPKNPKDLYSFEGSDDTFGNCPICGDLCNDEMKFCDKCGQALDWGDKDETSV